MCLLHLLAPYERACVCSDAYVRERVSPLLTKSDLSKYVL